MNRTLTRVFTWAGVALLLTAIGAVAVWRLTVSRNETRAAETVSALCGLLPQIQDGVPDGRSDTAMPVLEFDGTDFIGLLEVPAYGRVLPVCGGWDASATAKYPHRFAGSMYDGSLVIGGSDNAGQLDFMKRITNGDTVYLTDVTGVRFAYTVVAVEKTRDVSAEHLCAERGGLTLFARNSYGLEYTVVRCSFSYRAQEP